MRKHSNHKFPDDLSWDIVFNTSHKRWTIDGAREAANMAGYEYFMWNNRVFHSETGDMTYAILDRDTVDKKSKFIYDLDSVAEDYIGRQVEKVSGKPFKSKQKVNTVAQVLHTNQLSKDPHPSRPAFKFEEDEGVVECQMVKILD